MQVSTLSLQHRPIYNNVSHKTNINFKADRNSDERKLGRHLKTHNYCYQIALNGYLREITTPSNYVGCLPISMLKNVNKSEFGKKTEEVDEIFSNFAKSTSSEKDTEPETLTPQIKKLQENLSKTLGLNIQVSYLGKGCVGKTFKIKTPDETLVLKTYHSNLKKIISPRIEDYHGNNIELANALFAQKTAHKNKFAKFYMGKFETENSPGYILTKYIEKPDKFNKSQPQYFDSILIQRFLDYLDGDKNRIGNTIIEYGGIYAEEEIFDPKVRKLVRSIAKALDANDLESAREILEKHENSIELKKALNYTRNKIRQRCKIGDFIDNNKTYPNEIMDLFGFSPDYKYQVSDVRPSEKMLRKLKINPDKVQFQENAYHKHNHEDFW